MVKFNSGRHIRYRGELDSFLRRRFGRDDLFVIQSRVTGMWSVCVWESEGNGLFTEIYGFPGPGSFTPQDVQRIEFILRPDTRTKAQKRQDALSQSRDEYRRDEDELQEAYDAKRFLARKLGIDNPLMNLPGGFPVSV